MSSARWYCLSREGYATLCFDYEDAKTTAAENDAIFPKQAPHRAVQLVEAAARTQKPVAWIQPDHLQKARVAPFLCRVEPTKRMADFVPLYAHPPTLRALSDEQIESLHDGGGLPDMCGMVSLRPDIWKFAEAVQRALAAHNGMELVE